ncbi:hypothetical protein N7536_000826 [Penicillium majusculum]|nr:hypothetical protein N7536_000826 [Penicillium majusculum]
MIDRSHTAKQRIKLSYWPQLHHETPGERHRDGGRSCQISVSSDRKPAKSSECKVINSYEINCPANVPDNMDSCSAAESALQLQFTILSGIESPSSLSLPSWQPWPSALVRLGNREAGR